MLVKMMYSSSGMSMPCFEKRDEAIRQIELRFNPERVVTDAQLNLHCQKLINSSLDNWATKWYDRFQYFAQGIFY
jgi:phosphatidylinositol kinase/protein kinase (PI-3  family)